MMLGTPTEADLNCIVPSVPGMASLSALGTVVDEVLQVGSR